MPWRTSRTIGGRQVLASGPDWGLVDRPLIGPRLRRGIYHQLTPCNIREDEYKYGNTELGLQPFREGLTIASHDKSTGRDILIGMDKDRALRSGCLHRDLAIDGSSLRLALAVRLLF